MRAVTGIAIFYKKLILPAVIVSLVIGFLGMIASENFSVRTVGMAYFPNSLLFQYFIYEIRNPEEYYFYYNLGFNKLILWGVNLILSFIVALILVIL